MPHLTLESLARLLDEPAEPDVAAHLAHCRACREELDALRDDAAALRELPALEPPPADAWPALAARLRDERLVRDDVARRPRRVAIRLRGAAAAAVFLLGGVVGALLQASLAAPAGNADDDVAPLPHISRTPADAAGDPFLELHTAERAYFAALERLAALQPPDSPGDPAARLAALERIVRTTRDALRDSPADPVLNGYHLTAVAQRDAVMRQLARTSGGMAPITPRP